MYLKNHKRIRKGILIVKKTKNITMALLIASALPMSAVGFQEELPEQAEREWYLRWAIALFQPVSICNPSKIRKVPPPSMKIIWICQSTRVF